MNITHTVPAANTVATIFPGGALDPEYGSGGASGENQIWYASGTVKAITLTPDTTATLNLIVYDCVTQTAKPISTGGFENARYSIDLANAAGLLEGYGGNGWNSGVEFFEVRSSDAASELVDNGIKWSELFPNQTAGTNDAPRRYEVNEYCAHGMAVVVLSVAKARNLTISIEYEPDVLGPQRYINATYGNAHVIAGT